MTHECEAANISADVIFSFTYLFHNARRLKTYLRASLSQRKLNHLMILGLYADEVDAMDMNAIVNEFITRGDSKQRNAFALL